MRVDNLDPPTLLNGDQDLDLVLDVKYVKYDTRMTADEAAGFDFLTEDGDGDFLGGQNIVIFSFD